MIVNPPWMYMLLATTRKELSEKLLKPTLLTHVFHLGGAELTPRTAFLYFSPISLEAIE